MAVVDDGWSAAGNMDVAVPDLAFLQGVPFENQEVRHAGADMAGRHGAQRRGDEVRREGDVVDFGEMRDLAALREAAALRYVGHDDVRALLLEELAKAPAKVEVFPDADRRPA